ncbi:MAG TPA: HAD-IC family P-type ATPase [Methylophilus sp.]|nr:HAD-IC family P-type ATPase [Methylophilus sp.]HQQ32736.1 HAD-IC family P-type ATPase [Methylophilus sp.]
MWHHQSQQHIFSELEVSPEHGLNEAEATRRLTQYGHNSLPQQHAHPAWLRFLLQFHNVLIYVLLGSALVTALLGHIVDTAVIIAVVLANAVIGFIQEGKAEAAMNAIRHMLALQARVLREGKHMTIPSDLLVPGDIVLLEAGDKVAADLRLIETHNMSAEEAILTGESVPVEKDTAISPENAVLGDQSGMAFSGTLITTGSGRGVVVATGTNTEIGRISGMLSEVEMLETPLTQQMGRFARWLTGLILGIAALLLVYGNFVAHLPFAELFMAGVGLSVAAIPEGLPAVLTITLAVAVQAMARKQVIVRRLPAIETLGSVSVICTDKTGTLTRNEMMVASLVTAEGRFAVSGNGYVPEGKLQALDNAGLPVKLADFGRTSALCNDAALVEKDGIWQVQGDPMEGALLAFAAKAGFDLQQDKLQWARTDLIPFDAKTRYMAVLCHNHAREAFVFVKGAPERVLEMCDTQFSASGETEPLDCLRWIHEASAIAAQGQRVLALAIRPMPSQHTVLAYADAENQLSLLGLVGLIDPPRPEVTGSIQDCYTAGIQVKMITGDHAGTAAAIAAQIGLKNPEQVLTGTQIDAMSDAELTYAILDTNVFARTNPEHKLRLVMALQAQGMTVAMTGDGVNDAPALKRADAGVAMGCKGSEAAKEAAEIVLVDDHFASIVAAVREGRTAYDNIKKVISWTLPTNAGEAMTIIVALLLGITLPITAVQILWVNLITAITLGLVLAFEPTEAHTMQRLPRKRSEPLLDGALAWHIVLVAMLFLVGVFGIYEHAMQQGYSLDLARTMAVNTLVVMEIFHLLFIRNLYATSLTWRSVRGTPVVWGTIIIVILAQLAFTYLPLFQRIFDTLSIPLADGLLIVGVGVTLFVIVELEKRLRLYVANRF